MTTISALKKIKKQWLEDTFSEAQLKKEFKLTPTDIKYMKSESEYGKTRYHKNEVFRLLDLKKQNNI